MRRLLAGLHNAALEGEEVPDGLYLVEVRRAQYRWHVQKPFYLVRFVVLEPKSSAEAVFSGRLYCTPKALWKLAWFLRDFRYDTDLFANDEIDEKAFTGLRGVVKISHATMHRISVLNLDGFAPAARWQELSSGATGLGQDPRAGEVAS
jgi:hypothetical protein